MEDHNDSHPHNFDLKEIPHQVVLNYFNYLIRMEGFEWCQYMTLKMVKLAMFDYVVGLPADENDGDWDRRIIIEEGWNHHELKDTGPWESIAENIQTMLEEKGCEYFC